MQNPTNEGNKVINQQHSERGGPRLDERTFGYRKALGMIRVAQFAANRFPFKSDTLRLVCNEQEWLEVESMYGDGLVYRVDYQIGSRPNIDANPTNVKKDIPAFLQKLSKHQGMALLLLEYTEELVPRYAYDGGFSVLFLPNQEVILEVSGRGFDGRSVTSGRAVCDTFRIPWEVASCACDMSMEVLLELRVYHVVSEIYEKQRQQRIKDLMSNDLSQEFLDLAIPKEYRLPEDAVLDLVRNVIPRLAGQWQKITMELGHDVYAVHGNLVRGKAQVWELFDRDCWERDFCPANVETVDYKKEIRKLNDENVAILHYLKVPYDHWRFLTLYGEETLYLELQEISYNYDGYKRIQTLHELLVEQREITEGCWKLVDEGLMARARAVGDCIEGRKSQSLRLHLSIFDDEWKTSAFSLQIAYNGILKAEKEKLGVGPDRALEKQIDELFEREGRLGDKLFRRFQLQEPDLNGFTVERASLGKSKNPDIFLSDPQADVVHAYCKKFEANIYGYAEFLRCIAPQQFFWQ